MSSEVMLRFSLDTLRFDTVFTQLGSATRSFKVFNDFDESIEISNIRLANESSFFRLNIDGFSNNDISNIKILPNDSLWVFTEVTIDPDAPLSVSPFVVEDQVLFNTNGNDQLIRLEAWGQNANYLPNRFGANGIDTMSTFCNFDTVYWDDPKPYVIYGLYLVRGCNIVLPPGTRVYIHGGIANNDFGIYNDGLWLFGPNASLTSRGTLEDPVVIQGDRLEPEFQDISGQWPGVRFLSGSTGNSLRHTLIKNSIVGIQVDSAAQVSLSACEISNTSSSGLVAVNASVEANNCLFHTNGNNAVQVVYGGEYNMNYCTFANYGNQGEALSLLNFRCNDPLCLEGVFVSPLNANFTNCIVMGSSSDEIVLSDATLGEEPEFFKYNFDHCIVRVDELIETDQFPDFFNNCENCLNIDLSDTLFLDLDMDDYSLDTMSIARDIATPLSNITIDKNNLLRDPITPDLGCFEFQD